MNLIETGEIQMNKTLKTLLVIGLIAGSVTTMAQQSTKEHLSIRNVTAHLTVEMKTIKPSFKPDEAIKFNIKGNQDFFLYIFAIDDQFGTVTMMLPNKLQTGNKYTAKQLHRVPNATEMELVSDKPGTEKIVMLASTKYLHWNTNGYTEAGKYMHTSNERSNTQLEALRIRKPNQTVTAQVSNGEIIMREMLVQISGIQATPVVSNNTSLIGQLTAQQAQVEQPVALPQKVGLLVQSQLQSQVQAMGDTAIVFLSMDKAKYKAGDDAYIVYGVDRPGYVHLLLIDSRHRYSEIKAHITDGLTIFREKAKTAKPRGNHVLIAAWSKDGKLNIKSIPELKKAKVKKQEAFIIYSKTDTPYKAVNFKVK